MADLVKREEALAKHLRGADGRLEQDFSDRVAYTEMDEVIEGLDDAAREEVRQIRRALERVDAGEGDDCEACGEPIGEARLKVVPTATRCVNCAA
jgi:RNA polymerase-binding transcription factor DksA